jgi:hypothetical protein
VPETIMMGHTTQTLGRRFVEALAARDRDRLAAVLHPQVDFRGMTPNRVWEAEDPAAVLDIVLGNWFTPADRLDEVVLVQSDAFADREQLRFRFKGNNADGQFVVEQQAYLSERDERIGWMRVVCSGFRPAS